MGKTYTIELEENDLGQLLDGLRSRSELWQNTADFFESGYNPCADFIIEECKDDDEARAIADHYERIISTLESQMKAQG